MQHIKLIEYKPITGRLENWHYDPFGRNVLWGNLFDDKRRRWPDDHYVSTSRIKECRGFKEGDLVKTNNSLYLLGKRK